MKESGREWKEGDILQWISIDKFPSSWSIPGLNDCCYCFYFFCFSPFHFTLCLFAFLPSNCHDYTFHCQFIDQRDVNLIFNLMIGCNVIKLKNVLHQLIFTPSSSLLTFLHHHYHLFLFRFWILNIQYSCGFHSLFLSPNVVQLIKLIHFLYFYYIK